MATRLDRKLITSELIARHLRPCRNDGTWCITSERTECPRAYERTLRACKNRGGITETKVNLMSKLRSPYGRGIILMLQMKMEFKFLPLLRGCHGEKSSCAYPKNHLLPLTTQVPKFSKDAVFIPESGERPFLRENTDNDLLRLACNEILIRVFATTTVG